MAVGTTHTRTLGYGETALVVGAALGTGAFAMPELVGWPPTPAAIAFCALTLTNVLLAALSRPVLPGPALPGPAAVTDHWTTVRPTFVVELTALLLLGARAAVIVSAACAIVRLLSTAPGRARPSEMLLPAAAPLVALEAAAFTHLALGGTIGTFAWPWQAVPIAAAVLAYCLVLSAVSEIALPLLSSRPLTTSWPAVVLTGCPSYLTAAGLAVVMVELIERRMWTVALVAVVPVDSIYRVYADHLEATTTKTAARTRWRRSTTACRWSIRRASSRCGTTRSSACSVARPIAPSASRSGASSPSSRRPNCRERCRRRRERRNRCGSRTLDSRGRVAPAWWTCASCLAREA